MWFFAAKDFLLMYRDVQFDTLDAFLEEAVMDDTVDYTYIGLYMDVMGTAKSCNVDHPNLVCFEP